MIECKDCMYYDKSAGLGIFPSGRCHGYFGKGELLVNDTDYCSRGKEGTFEEYVEMNRKACAYIMQDLLDR